MLKVFWCLLYNIYIYIYIPRISSPLWEPKIKWGPRVLTWVNTVFFKEHLFMAASYPTFRCKFLLYSMLQTNMKGLNQDLPQKISEETVGLNLHLIYCNTLRSEQYAISPHQGLQQVTSVFSKLHSAGRVICQKLRMQIWALYARAVFRKADND